MPECKSKGMACRRSDKLSNITSESNERRPSHQGQQDFAFIFDFALLCWCLFCFRMRRYHFMEVGLRENGKKLEIPSTKVNLSPLKFISYSFGKIYLL